MVTQCSRSLSLHRTCAAVSPSYLSIGAAVIAQPAEFPRGPNKSSSLEGHEFFISPDL